MAIRRRKKPSLVLPLSSMGDIAFLLIIFFMLASNFMKTGNVDLQRPGAPSLEQQEPAKFSVMVDRDGTVWYDGAQTTAAELASLLKPVVERDRDASVHVSVHKELKRDSFMPVIEAVSESGAKIILTGEPED
ncbi:MAG: biopolymer transporter ExbD [Kiritimatiellae bacterium]|nr:biopolymer transporter ExbD [Kiritimatiellia bacterium]